MEPLHRGLLQEKWRSERAVLCEKVATDCEGWSCVSIGSLLRKEAETGSERGQLCQKSVEEGELVPDEVVTDLLEAEIQNSGGSKFIIDGYPRSAAQGEAFEKRIGKFQLGIVVETPDDVLAARLAERGASSEKAQDQPEIVEKRISVFKENVVPFIETLKEQGKVQVVSDDGQALALVKTAVESIVPAVAENADAADVESPVEENEAQAPPAEAPPEKPEEAQVETQEVEAATPETAQEIPEVSEVAVDAEAPVVEESCAEPPAGVEEVPVEASTEKPSEEPVAEQPPAGDTVADGEKPSEESVAEQPPVEETTTEGEKPTEITAVDGEVVPTDGKTTENEATAEAVAAEGNVEEIAAEGSPGQAVEPEADQERQEQAAATRIQAVQRGRQARKKVGEMKKPTEAADAENSSGDQIEATVEAEAPSGPDAEVDPAVESNEAGSGEQPQEANAGESAEKPEEVVVEPTEADPVEVVDEGVVESGSAPETETVDVSEGSEKAEFAATKIQSVHRGRMARKEVGALKEARKVEHEKSSAAATKIQSVQRGRKARKEVDQLKTSKRLENEKQELAATRIQSAQRGRKARQEVEQLRSSRLQEEKAKQGVAATKIQSVHRGRKARKEVEQIRKTREESSRLRIEQEREAAAKKIQAVHRGRSARQNVSELRKAKAKEERAAVQIQSVQRGRIARKEVADLRSKKRAALEKEKILSIPASAASPQSKKEKSEKSRKGEKRINVREYMDSTVTPILRDGLKALNASRPADPIQFLCDYLMDSKKSLPQGGQ
ncbi:hypothetical protein BSKO_13043 [Bryopsis sp. KO-2023]|nr:hypothetical protein BSKO_13043 [Bryopsis sp. KO-2023]